MVCNGSHICILPHSYRRLRSVCVIFINFLCLIADEISSIDSDESTPDDDVVPASVMITSLACTMASSLMCLIMILVQKHF